MLRPAAKAADEGSFDVARECLEVREASGLHASSDMALLDHAIARFRFDQLPLVRAPGEDAAEAAAADGKDEKKKKGEQFAGSKRKFKRPGPPPGSNQDGSSNRARWD